VRPGFLARVDFALQGKGEALAVPAAAVGVGEAGACVFVVDADTLVRKAVRTGLTAGGWMEITGGRGVAPPRDRGSGGRRGERSRLARFSGD